MEKEIWKPVVGYEGLYEVSNLGRIKSINLYAHKEPVILSTSQRKDGYLNIHLSKNNICKTYTVHRVVALAFIPNPNNLEMINHKDENRANNRVENLEWCSRKYNQLYSIKLHPERKRLFYNNFLDENGRSNSPMLISEARKRKEPIAYLDENLEIVKIYNNWVEVKKDFPECDYNIYETCRRNINNSKRICKHKKRIFVFLNDEKLNKNAKNQTIIDKYFNQ